MKDIDLIRYKHILAIDPAFSFKNGLGFALFDDETSILKRCGIIRPFANLESYNTTIEIAKKVHLFWEKEVGFSYNPSILCIESPKVCFMKKNVRVNTNSIIMLAVLCTRIEDKFNAKTVLRPSPRPVKKEQTQENVLNTLDRRSKQVLAQEITTIPAHLRHNVFDAVGLGLWAIKLKNDAPQAKKNGRK